MLFFSIQSHIFVTIIKIIYTNMAIYGILWQFLKNCHTLIFLLFKYLQHSMAIWQFFFKNFLLRGTIYGIISIFITL